MPTIMQKPTVYKATVGFCLMISDGRVIEKSTAVFSYLL